MATLTGVPYQQLAYGETLDRGTIQLRAARVAEYGGLIFATWDDGAPGLDEYLGDAR